MWQCFFQLYNGQPTDNLISFIKKLRDHRDSRESRQEWRLVFLAPVALPYGEVKNFS